MPRRRRRQPAAHFSPANRQQKKRTPGFNPDAAHFFAHTFTHMLQSPRWLLSLGLGQAIALLIALTGVFSTLLVRANAAAPTAQSLGVYLLLGLVFGVPRWVAAAREGRWPRTVVPVGVYALLALVDVEANYLVVKAYAYTSITSIMLLDAWTIPVVMALSAAFLRRRYAPAHFFGVFFAAAGLAALVASDALQSDGGGDGGGGGGGGGADSLSVRGDLLCLAGATLYAVSNVGQEFLVKAHDRVEFLGMLGGFGALFNGAQLLVLERDELATVEWTPAVIASWAGFTASLAGMYVLTSFFLQRADATLFNLCLLSSDLWAILAAVCFFGATLSWLYFVALALIVVGLVLYNSAREVGSGEQLSASPAVTTTEPGAAPAPAAAATVAASPDGASAAAAAAPAVAGVAFAAPQSEPEPINRALLTAT